MRIIYHNKKLYISLTKDEVNKVNKKVGSPTEIYIGNLKVLHEDVNKAVFENWKDLIDAEYK
tara:strand:- start:2062 stop:2247 length:186 start_codon:yes stop_codon:yes gene_type:complete